MGIANKRIDAKIEENDSTVQEVLTISLINKDKTEKNGQMISDLLSIDKQYN